MTRSRLKHALLPALTLLAATLTTGCMRREMLTTAVFETELTKTNEDANRIRLYVNRTLIVTRRDIRDAGKDVRKDVYIKGRRKVLHETIGRWTHGRMVEIDETNGKRRLWIAFERSCHERECAFGFVQTDDGARYRLMHVPGNPVFDEVKVRGRDWAIGWELEEGYVHSLAEANQVFRGYGYFDKLITVDLVFVERWKPKLRRWDRKSGAGREDRRRHDLVSDRPEPKSEAKKKDEKRGSG